MGQTDGWEKKIDLDDRDDFAYGIAVDSTENVFVAGSRSTVDEHRNAVTAGTEVSAVTAAWTKKCDAIGSEKTSNWNKSFQSA